jgi:hypothetical protein
MGITKQNALQKSKTIITLAKALGHPAELPLFNISS